MRYEYEYDIWLVETDKINTEVRARNATINGNGDLIFTAPGGTVEACFAKGTWRRADFVREKETKQNDNLLGTAAVLNGGMSEVIPQRGE